VLTGDTKVMGKGEIDGIVINTTAIGLTDHLVRDAACGRETGSSSPVRSAITGWR
jgi:hydrogenase expression/formation protein HypE